MPGQLFGYGRSDWSSKLIHGLGSEAPAGFRSRRGDGHDRTPVAPQNAAFPTYKAPRVHHAARRWSGRIAARGAGCSPLISRPLGRTPGSAASLPGEPRRLSDDYSPGISPAIRSTNPAACSLSGDHARLHMSLCLGQKTQRPPSDARCSDRRSDARALASACSPLPHYQSSCASGSRCLLPSFARCSW